MKRTALVTMASAVTVAALVAGCKRPCSPTDASCHDDTPEAIPTYSVTLENAPANLGAIVISFDGQRRAMLLSIEPSLRSAVREGEGRTTWRAAVVGTIVSGRIGTITRDTPGGAAPQAAVVQAAAGAAGGYATIPPSQISIAVRRLN